MRAVEPGLKEKQRERGAGDGEGEGPRILPKPCASS